MIKIVDNEKYKIVSSEHYNMRFDKSSGYTETWGKTKEENPLYAPFAEIIDMEISTVCNGIGNGKCKMCYKAGQTNVNTNMSFEQAKIIIDKLPKIVQQIAYGIGQIDGNPDLWKIMQYTRECGIIPNITTNGYNLTDEYAQNLANLCGATSVSKYEPKDCCYDAVKKLTDLGMKQVNIHQLVSKETLNACYEVIDDYSSDERLSKLNAIVFLALKPKGKTNTFSVLKYEEYEALIKYAIEKKVPIGGDSCQMKAMHKVFSSIGQKEMADTYMTSCESLLTSMYINVDSTVFPCSFTEGEDGVEGISLLDKKDYIKDVWYSDMANNWRKRLLNTTDCNGCRKCLMFDEVNICE